jgi:acetyl esterase/lipase
MFGADFYRRESPMANDRIAQDPRIDPRIKALMGAIDIPPSPGDVADREVLLKEQATEEAATVRAMLKGMMDMFDTEEVAPSAGLDISEHRITSQPDGNTINLRFIRPAGDEVVPCVYYIHGGGMASMSCYDGNYRAWGRVIANCGVAVAMIDFRNCLSPSSVPEVEPFPAGLNDCVSGLEWVAGHAGDLGIDGARVVVAGESGGGNLTLATGLKLKQDGKLGLISAPTLPVRGPARTCRRRPRTMGSCSICTTTGAPWRTEWRSSRPAIRWRGRCSRVSRTWPGCRRPSSA